MRFSSRGLDDVFTYPCTKADIREAFSDDLLQSASFGLTPDYHFDFRSRAVRGEGKVLLALSLTPNWPDQSVDRVSLYVYRVRKERWSDYLHWQAREIMRTAMRPWAEEVLVRPETARDGYRQMIVALEESRLVVQTPKEG